MSAVNSLNQKALTHAFESAFIDEDIFDDTVNAAQKIFRTLLAATAHPGKIFSLSPLPKLPSWIYASHDEHSPQAQNRLAGLLALARTLCHGDTPLWLDESLRSPALCQYLRFHCGSPLLEKDCASQSAFAFIGSAQDMPRLSEFQKHFPHPEAQPCTLIIACSLSKTMPLTSSEKNHLPQWFWEDYERNDQSYPMGIDCIFVDAHADGVQLMALPHSVRIKK